MVEGASSRQPDAEPKLRQSQRETGGVVRAEITPQKNPETAPKPEFSPESLERALEGYDYKVGQEVFLMGDKGAMENWQVVSMDQDLEMPTVFLVRRDDTRTPPSIEVVNERDLALNEVGGIAAIEAGKFWNEVTGHYTDSSKLPGSGEQRQAKLNEHKGRLLRLAGFKKIQSSESLKNILNEVVGEHILVEAEKAIEHDPRHRERERLMAKVRQLAVARGAHQDALVQSSPPASELLNAKIAVLENDVEFDEVIFPDAAQSHEDRTYTQAKEVADSAWRDLYVKESSAKQRLTYQDENSFAMLAISEALDEAYESALRAEIALNDVRVRTDKKGVGEISLDEVEYWNKATTEWRAKPGVAAGRKDRPAKTPARKPTFPDKLPNSKKASPEPPYPTETETTREPSGLARFINKITDWLGL